MSERKIKKDIGIVGAGPGGLAAGMLLADEGFNVEIFEVKDRVGGRNSWFEEEGYRFDVGPTFFMMPFILREIFEKTGRDLDDYVELERLEPFYQIVYSDEKKLKTYYEPRKFKESIANINEGDVEGYNKFMNRNEKKMKYTLPVLQKPYSNLFDLINFDMLKLLTVLSPQRSLWDDLGLTFSDDRVKVGFTFQSKYLGMSPYNCPSMFSILPFIEYNWGIYHVMGGLNQLSQAMAKVFREEKGTIKLNTEVKEVIIEKGNAKGLKLDNTEIKEYDEVILNSDFAWSMKNLFSNKERRKYTNDKLDDMGYSCSTFMLYLGMDKEYNDLEHNNIFIAEDYQKNFLQIESKNELPKDPSFYVQNASVTDPSLAPEGHSVLYILVPVSNLKGEIDWTKEKEDFKNLVLDKLEQKIGEEEIRDHIVYEKVLTPEDWKDEFNVGYGATFNLAHNLTQMLYFRPHNKFEEFDNIWLVGGGTNPGSGLPTIYESGRITANLIKKKYGLDYTFRHNKEIEKLE
ncbi:MAG: Phytoene dehydrogenase family enzyme [Candidatus Methanohalarchaeum thermophilum]|uniref:Phytoene dehydrogenase family enzyme n=1 Tax=Methanohalarchaeum thermophilum TaxID=1903181 RepID=A0A1Q6DXH8_METT1|nr:MAG: Phytoene dehydrogenase family enzyme [Candidatus Methanohalarchaeum thermophilum]